MNYRIEIVGRYGREGYGCFGEVILLDTGELVHRTALRWTRQEAQAEAELWVRQHSIKPAA